MELVQFSSVEQRNLMLIRSVLALLAGSAIILPALWQPFIDRSWFLLKSSTIYNSSIWETVLTILSYGVVEAFYTAIATDPNHTHARIDQRQGKSHLYRNGTPLIKPYGRRLWELLEYAGPLIFLDLTMVKKFPGVPVDDIIRSGGYDVEDSFDSLTGIPIKGTWKIPTLHNFTWRHPVQLMRALPHSAPSSRQIVLTVIGALVLYDFLFFLPHIAMHKVKLLWSLHVPHHRHAEIHPQITNQLSITERMTLLLAANLSLHLLGAHPLTRTIFVPIFLYLLIENHTGLDLPYGYHRMLPSGWAAGPAEHAEHHRHGRANFQPYLTWADRLLGTHSTGHELSTDPDQDASFVPSKSSVRQES